MRILNFGSLNIDNVYRVDHFVRPGETISSEKLNTFCGGKGLNQSIALARAGARVYHAGKIGKDGEMLLRCLKENGVDTSYIQIANCLSGHAIIQVDKSGQNCIILYGGANEDINESDVDAVLSGFKKGDILLLQNEISCIGEIIEKAHSKGMKIALNPSPIDHRIKGYPLQYITWFILNEIEGNELTGATDPEIITDELLKKYPGASVVLTLGKKGVLYKDNIRSVSHGTYNVRVVDTTAAGDTFTGYFLACMAEGLTVEVALEKASIASSIAVSCAGASDSIPGRQEVDDCNLK